MKISNFPSSAAIAPQLRRMGRVQTSDKDQITNFKPLNFDVCLPAIALAKAGCLNFKRLKGAFNG